MLDWGVERLTNPQKASGHAIPAQRFSGTLVP
jgi:hypothetical protein